ncbi:DUF1707 SHOCT-like domain-containing protein [Jiangella asiatica]|uniref:DUF1707 domain-containing protein n=1 Tax=Jiangella asiatica TaxID=2530372 RepID=A0A4R5DBX3_9ACTN|nr:DUF1707 domain-containing protein [Jiangella asiatica]TDE09311.1 DUF1707 domain-containing protein [Jiangella asiatica]
MSIEEPSGRAERDRSLMRVSHADRDRMVEILRDAAADGRLDTDELEERVERALTARTFADLESLTEDLPVAAPAPPAARVPAPPAPTVTEGEVEQWHVTGQRFRREGAWRVPPIVELNMFGGSARLDYTQARLPEDGHSTLRISTYGGSVRLTVPPGVAVDLSGISRSGGRVRDKVSRHAAPATRVTHVITVTGSMIGGSVRVEASNAQ